MKRESRYSQEATPVVFVRRYLFLCIFSYLQFGLFKKCAVGVRVFRGVELY